MAEKIIKRRKSTAEEGVVYFIRHSTGGRIKVGTSHFLCVNKRLADLQRMNPEPLELLAVCMGGQPLEKAIHRQFKHLQSHGEWFEPAPELLTFIAEKVLDWRDLEGYDGWERAMGTLAKVLKGMTFSDLLTWMAGEEARIREEESRLNKFQLLAHYLACEPDVRSVLDGASLRGRARQAEFPREAQEIDLGEVIQRVQRRPPAERLSPALREHAEASN